MGIQNLDKHILKEKAFPTPVSELSWVITYNEWFAITETVKIKSTLQSYL